MTRVNVNQPKPVLTLKGRKPKSGSARPIRQAANDARARRANQPAQRAQPEHRERTDGEVLAELQSVTPDLWNAQAPAPLAIGIHKQLYPVAERLQMSRKALRKFLSRWTSASAYQKALTEPGAQRFNADGSTAGEVQQQHQDRARERVTAHG